jgi:hypothetical protein
VRGRLSFYHPQEVEDIEALAESEFAAIPKASLQAWPKNSEPFDSYGILPGGPSGCVPVPGDRRGTADPRAAGFAKEIAAASFEKLKTFKNSEHMAYLKRKLGDYYSEAPNGASPAAWGGVTRERGGHWICPRSRPQLSLWMVSATLLTELQWIKKRFPNRFRDQSSWLHPSGFSLDRDICYDVRHDI